MEKHAKCTNCVWATQCSSDEPCEYYDDGELTEELQQDKEDFTQQWMEYLPREGANFFKD